MSRFSVLFLSLAYCFTLLFADASRVVFTADGSSPGGIISNKVSNVNVWDMGTQFVEPQRDEENDIYEFVEYVQLMQCSGGTLQRDLFRDPSDGSVMDDYDFSRLVENCRGILSLGAKPLLKLGGVPIKYSDEPVLGGFDMNVHPPRDYNVYYNYIYALADTLVQSFGRDEVRSWRFGVMTEFENEAWFYAGNSDPKASMEAYCKLYDYTVQALIDAIAPDVFVGAHAMAVTEGLWDENLFIRHVAKGVNYATGKTGTRICYLSASFYDSCPGRFTKGKTLPKTIADLRKKAESYGLRDLIYCVDEGRILSASEGKESSDLASRTVGHTWQAAYDARLWAQTIRNDIDYFSSWGYLSGGLKGYPTVSYHVAKAVHSMAGEQKLKVSSTGTPLRKIFSVEVDGAASFDPEAGEAHILLYNFRNKLTYKKRADVELRLKLPRFAGQTLTLREWRIDDDCNFFDEWQQDRVKYGITDDCFAWSPDDPCLDDPTTLSDPAARALYFEKRRDRYVECSKLTPTEQTCAVGEDGTLRLNRILDANTVLFLELA